VLRENDELKPSESDVGGLLSDLVEGARRATSFAQQPHGLRADLESVPRLGRGLEHRSAQPAVPTGTRNLSISEKRQGRREPEIDSRRTFLRL
jgi:hypothetical protein